MSGIAPISGYTDYYSSAVKRNTNGLQNFDIPGQKDDQASGVIKNPGESTEKLPVHRSSPAESETCKNRKYQDGSDEMVSFKSAAHITPEAAATRVRAHEQEHVSNAYNKAKTE